MKSTGLVQPAPGGFLRETGERGIESTPWRSDKAQLTAPAADGLLRIVSQAARIKSHFELFTLLQGEIQHFVSHQILIGAWGDFLEPQLNLDVISAIEGVRTSRLSSCNIEGQCKRLYLRWLAHGRQPFQLEGGACELRTHPPCNCALHASLRRMQSVLVHGFHDARAGNDSLYVAADANPPGSSPGIEHSLALLDAVVAQIDLAFRRVAGFKSQRSSPSKNVGGLSAREAEILGLVSLGRTNHEISTLLGISTFTVKNHVQRIIRKLGVVNRTEAAARYRRLGTGTERPLDAPSLELVAKRETGITAK